MYPFKKKQENPISDETEAALRRILDELHKPKPQPALVQEKPQAPPEPPRQPVKRYRAKDAGKKVIMGIAGLAFGGFIILALFGLAMLMMSNAANIILYYIIGVYAEAAVIVFLVLILAMYYSWLKPVWSYKGARNQSGKAWMILIHKSGEITTEVSKYISEVFETEKNPKRDPLAFFKNDRVNTHLGPATVGVFYDGVGVSGNAEFALACEELRKKGYESIDAAKKDWETGKLKLTVPMFKEIDFSALLDYIYTKPATLRAYTDTKVNLDRLNREQKFYENPQVMAFALFLVCACFGIGILKAMHVF